ncbi:hypothetical protein Cgig2_012456 [Carnegiea gigantea]|uniref:Phospholipase/carboxylesterase/thioesterase domain-containing protein n=1 Tax=Carnegiea gigantea TaxID=171969 RepID=A0A9Q1KLF8_9CARY|nr:hypothetical protein Cgig2_012456 [Carnegiea gigantea]
MSYTNYPTGSGARNARTSFEFGRTHVIRPKGRHLATIVWLHGLGDNGASASQLLEPLPLPNVKWICPTAPTRPVALLGGFTCTAWFDVAEISEDSPDDLEGLDASAAHIANLLSTEPAGELLAFPCCYTSKKGSLTSSFLPPLFPPQTVKLGIGGFNMGAATALYSATCFALSKYANGNLYPINLRAVVGLSGWLPGTRSLKNKIEGSHEATRRAASLPILLCHGRSDDVVAYKYGEKSAQALASAGFRNIIFKCYDGLGHYTVPREMDEVCSFLASRLGLECFR